MSTLNYGLEHRVKVHNVPFLSSQGMSWKLGVPGNPRGHSIEKVIATDKGHFQTKEIVVNHCNGKLPKDKGAKDETKLGGFWRQI